MSTTLPIAISLPLPHQTISQPSQPSGSAKAAANVRAKEIAHFLSAYRRRAGAGNPTSRLLGPGPFPFSPRTKGYKVHSFPLLLDQLPRIIYHDTLSAYSSKDAALELSLDTITWGADRELPPSGGCFLMLLDTALGGFAGAGGVSRSV
ncbi:hypothetical protein MMC10_008581 [Thelotrema lepadinum]|nr:hypothetical protein [Thelotrema lepadinum]